MKKNVFDRQERRDLKDVLEQAIDDALHTIEYLDEDGVIETRDWIKRLKGLKSKIAKMR